MALSRIAKLKKRAGRTRTAIAKRAGGKPRLSVYRSGKNITAQVIDDLNGKTVASASSLEKDLRDGVKGSTKEAAAKVGSLVAERAKKAGVENVVFDRGGYLFHGRVKALADAARDGGLNF
ncbi:MAG: 50S ribosomal protein L18 [Pseudomonadota bacterium]